MEGFNLGRRPRHTIIIGRDFVGSDGCAPRRRLLSPQRSLVAAAQRGKTTRQEFPVDLARQPHQRMAQFDDRVERRTEQVLLAVVRGLLIALPRLETYVERITNRANRDPKTQENRLQSPLSCTCSDPLDLSAAYRFFPDDAGACSPLHTAATNVPQRLKIPQLTAQRPQKGKSRCPIVCCPEPWPMYCITPRQVASVS